MKAPYRHPSGHRHTAHPHTPAPNAAQQRPLDDSRFQALLAQANSFFAEAERDMVAEKAAAIEEIRALMAQYDLSIEDIQD